MYYKIQRNKPKQQQNTPNDLHFMKLDQDMA